MSQFRIKNGLIIDNGGIAVTGSISSTAGITGSFSGSIAGFPTDVSAFSSSLSTRITATEATSSAYVTASGSLAARLASNEAKTGSYATTGSNVFTSNQTISGSLTTTGTITAQTLVVQTITSSVEYSSGSNVFGSNTSHTQRFTGSLLVSGSGYINGNVGIGSVSPVAKLDVAGTIAATTNPSDPNDSNAAYFWNQSGLGPTISGLKFAVNTGTTGNQTQKFIISDTGAATFSSSIAATAGTFTLNTIHGGFKVTGVAATPPNLAYLANNYFPKFYTRPDQNFGITIFDQSYATAIQSADIATGVSASALLLNPYGGNIGVGITNPARKLVVAADDTNSGDSGQFHIIGATNPNYKLMLGYDTSSEYAYIKSTKSGTSTKNLVLQPDGSNVGIGITNPGTRLQVSGSDSDGITISGGTNGRKIATTATSVDFYTTTIDAGWAMGIYSKKASDSTVLSSIAGAYGNTANTLVYNFYGGTDYANAAMYIPTSKNVGIGTTNPSSKLQVEVAAESPASGSIALIAKTSNGINDIFRWYDGATQLGVFKNSGNIGIGVTNPGDMLHINKNGTSSYAAIRITNTNSTADYYIGVGGSGVANTPLQNNAYIMNAAASGLAFGTSDTVRMFINSSGLVGIGTTSPSQKLSVGSITGGGTATSTPTCITLDDTFGNNTIGTNFKLKLFQDSATNRYGLGVSDSLFEIAAGSGGAISFFTNGATERMRIASNGQVTLSNSTGIRFANGSSNLNYYEEGTWTPILSGTGGGAYTAASGNNGRYVRIGNQVTVEGTLVWSGGGAYAGNLIISGLPFASSGVRSAGSIGAVSSGINYTAGYGMWVLVNDPTTSYIYIIQLNTSGAGYSHTPTVASSGTIYGFTLTYFIV
jgi:hypothetical protein